MTNFWGWFEDYAAPRLSGGNAKMNRANTFRAMFKHLDQFENPCIVETGCIEEPDNWAGNGCSTIMFDRYAKERNGHVFSVDIDKEKVSRANDLTSTYTNVFCNDSVSFLKGLDTHGASPNLLYLDASHLHWYVESVAQVHHWLELQAAMPHLAPGCLVAVDDSPAVIDERLRYDVIGKGGLVAKHAAEVGAELVFCEYQSGWLGFPGEQGNTNEATDALLYRARTFLEAGKWPQAYALYRTVLVRTPPPWNGIQRIMHGEACAYFARLALQFERNGAALDWFRRAIEADPRAIDYRIEMVNKVMIPLGIQKGAQFEAKKATKVIPNDPLGWRSLGLVEGKLGDLEASLAAHQRQLALSERSTVALLDNVATLIDLARYDEAQVLVEEAKERSNLKGDTLHAQGMIRARLGEHEQAVEDYKSAIAEKCSDPTLCHFHCALSLFAIGHLREGWEHHARRAKNRSDGALYVPLRRFDRPLFNWQGAPAIVHVHAEAGAGDNIALMRFLPMLADRGYTVRYETRSEFIDLVRDSMPGIEVVPMSDDYPGALGLKDFDYHLPIGEVPHAFGIDVDSIPWIGPYLKAQSSLPSTDRLRVGLCWSSGIRIGEGAWLERYGRMKAMTFSTLWKELGKHSDNIEFHSLQVGPERKEHCGLIKDSLPENPTWNDTASLVAGLDLVITVDTSVAHIAGAMGKPVWVMTMRDSPSWHFMCWRPGALWNERSPWYPTARIFRQHEFNRPHYWEEVVYDVCGALKNDLQDGHCLLNSNKRTKGFMT